MSAKPGTPVYRDAQELFAIYERSGKAAANARLVEMIAGGMTTMQYVVLTDTFRALLKEKEGGRAE